MADWPVLPLLAIPVRKPTSLPERAPDGPRLTSSCQWLLFLYVVLAGRIGQDAA
jgi:hypothetical protein